MGNILQLHPVLFILRLVHEISDSMECCDIPREHHWELPADIQVFPLNTRFLATTSLGTVILVVDIQSHSGRRYHRQCHSLAAVRHHSPMFHLALPLLLCLLTALPLRCPPPVLSQYSYAHHRLASMESHNKYGSLWHYQTPQSVLLAFLL